MRHPSPGPVGPITAVDDVLTKTDRNSTVREEQRSEDRIAQAGVSSSSDVNSLGFFVHKKRTKKTSNRDIIILIILVTEVFPH